jgi:hypothetical protein
LSLLLDPAERVGITSGSTLYIIDPARRLFEA